MGLDYVHTRPDEFEAGQKSSRYRLFAQNRVNSNTESVHTEPDKLYSSYLFLLL